MLRIMTWDTGITRNELDAHCQGRNRGGGLGVRPPQSLPGGGGHTKAKNEKGKDERDTKYTICKYLLKIKAKIK